MALTKPVRQSQLFDCLTTVMRAPRFAQTLTAPQPLPIAAPAAGQTSNQPRVLVAEDNPVNQQVARRLLRSLVTRPWSSATGSRRLQPRGRAVFLAV